jgi:hypothetical protein
MKTLERAASPPSLPPAQVAELKGQSKGPTTIGIVVSMTILSFLFVTCRLITRFGIIKNPGIEDYVIAIAMVCLRCRCLLAIFRSVGNIWSQLFVSPASYVLSSEHREHPSLWLLAKSNVGWLSSSAEYGLRLI